MKQSFCYLSDIIGDPVKSPSKTDINKHCFEWQKKAVAMDTALYLNVENTLIDLEWGERLQDEPPVHSSVLEYVESFIDINYPLYLIVKDKYLDSSLFTKYENNVVSSMGKGILISSDPEEKPDVLFLRYFNLQYKNKFKNWLYRN